MLDEDSNMAELEQEETVMNEDDNKLPQHALWVEKYTPRFFTELLSDDVSKNISFKFVCLEVLHGCTVCFCALFLLIITMAMIKRSLRDNFCGTNGVQ